MADNNGTASREPSNSQQANVGKQQTFPQSTPGGAGAGVGAGTPKTVTNGKAGKGF